LCKAHERAVSLCAVTSILGPLAMSAGAGWAAPHGELAMPTIP
jgi:hypothetical protein